MIVRKMPKETWNNFLKNKSHSVFQTYEWSQIMEVEGWHPVWLVNKDWSGGMVLMENDEHTAYESMRFGCYGGTIGEPVNIIELMSTDMNYIRIFDYNSTMKLEGWNKQMLSTYIINLDNYRLSNGRRDDLRIAKKEGLRIEETTNIERFYAVFVEAMKFFPNTTQIKPKEFFEKMCKYDFVKFHLVSKGSKDIGCSTHLLYNGEIFGYTAMVLPEFRNTGCTTFNLKHLMDSNPEYKTYNFGVGISDGNHAFKKSWGAYEHKYPIYGIIFQTKYEYE